MSARKIPGTVGRQSIANRSGLRLVVHSRPEVDAFAGWLGPLGQLRSPAALDRAILDSVHQDLQRGPRVQPGLIFSVTLCCVVFGAVVKLHPGESATSPTLAHVDESPKPQLHGPVSSEPAKTIAIQSPALATASINKPLVAAVSPLVHRLSDFAALTEPTPLPLAGEVGWGTCQAPTVDGRFARPAPTQPPPQAGEGSVGSSHQNHWAKVLVTAPYRPKARPALAPRGFVAASRPPAVHTIEVAPSIRLAAMALPRAATPILASQPLFADTRSEVIPASTEHIALMPAVQTTNALAWASPVTAPIKLHERVNVMVSPTGLFASLPQAHERAQRPIYKRPWFVGMLGVAATGIAAGVTAAVVSAHQSPQGIASQPIRISLGPT